MIKQIEEEDNDNDDNDNNDNNDDDGNDVLYLPRCCYLLYLRNSNLFM